MPHCLPESDVTLAERAWVARVNAARRDILQGRLDKVVLARSRQWQAQTKISARPLLEQLCAHQADACIYAFSQGESTFLGATPERLVDFNGTRIESEALAGTAWPGSPELAGPKNRHEQALVADAIIAALARCCVGTPQAGPLEIQDVAALADADLRPELRPAPHAPVATCPQPSYRLSWAVTPPCAADGRSAGHGESVPAGLPGRCASAARGPALAGPALLVPGGRRSARPAAPGAGIWPPPPVPSAPRGGSPVGQQLRVRKLMVSPQVSIYM